jgi:hypothetical protein
MGSKAPDPPDYSGIAAAATKNADLSYQAAMDANQTAKDQLAWAKQQYAENKPLTDKIVNLAIANSEEQAQNARTDRARYQAVYQPQEDKLVADADDYSSPARLQQQMGAAEATTAEQVNQARDASLANLQSYGVKPGAGKYLGADIAARTAGGAAGAAAGTTAATNTENIGRALREEAINVGKGYPAQVTSSYGGSTSAGASGNTSMNQTFQQGSSAMGTPTQWGSLGVSNTNASSNALSVWGNALNEGYNNALSASQQSTGIGSALGLVGSLAMAPMTGGGSLAGAALGKMFGLAKGGMVPGMRATGTPAVGYAGGGPVQGLADGGTPYTQEMAHKDMQDLMVSIGLPANYNYNFLSYQPDAMAKLTPDQKTWVTNTTSAFNQIQANNNNYNLMMPKVYQGAGASFGGTQPSVDYAQQVNTAGAFNNLATQVEQANNPLAAPPAPKAADPAPAATPAAAPAPPTGVDTTTSSSTKDISAGVTDSLAGKQSTPQFGPTTSQGGVTADNTSASYNPYLNPNDKSLGLARGGDVPPRGAPAVGGGVSFSPPPAIGQSGVPNSASPSGGSAVDDVPAALTAGEFVIPKDVAQWYGEQHLQKMILKARQDKQGAQAKPEMRPSGPPGPPTFVSPSSSPAVGMGAMG